MGTSTTIGKAEVSMSIERPASQWLGSHVSLIDYSLSGFLISSSRPTTPCTMATLSQINGFASIPSQSNWWVEMMTSRHFYFPTALELIPLAWFDKLCPGSITCWEDL